MDLIGAIKSAPIVDLAILFGLALFVIVGVVQGPIRRVLDIAAILVAFLFAANLKDTLGDFFNANWRQFDLGYNRTLAFAIVFVVLTVILTGAIQTFYHRVDLNPAHPIVDDILGAIVALVEGVLVLLIVVVILGAYRLHDARPGDLAQFRQAQDLIINQSHIAHWLREMVVPVFVHVLAPLLPADLVAVYP